MLPMTHSGRLAPKKRFVAAKRRKTGLPVILAKAGVQSSMGARTNPRKGLCRIHGQAAGGGPPVNM